MTVDELLANPARFDSQRVDVTGLWQYGFERSSFAGAWLERPAHAPFGHGTYRVRVVGIWHCGPSGHLGGSPAELRAESIEILEILDQQVDGLTGLPTRTALALAKPPCVIALFDLDHFKRFNDTHGHLAGDELLKRWASLTRSTLRPDDIVVRWGGEELAVAIYADLDTACELVERVRAAMRPITFSVGITELDATAFARADQALYEAKRAGRDRIIRASAAP